MASAAHTAAARHGAVTEDRDPEEVSEDLLEQVFEAARREHKEIMAGFTSAPVDFVSFERRQEANILTKGTYTDRTGARARGKEASAWCALYGVGMTFTMEVSAYTTDERIRIASEWCRKMQWFYDIAVRDAAEFTVYTDDVRATYVENSDFTAWAETLQEGVVRARVQALRDLWPSRTPGTSRSGASSSGASKKVRRG